MTSISGTPAIFGDRGILTIDLAALVANWRRLGALAPSAECAAVVKADGYGLGADKVGVALFEAGCRRFFVAHMEEAIKLRQALPKATIYCLHGIPAGAEADCLIAGIVPVLSTPEQIARWREAAKAAGRALPAALQADTGMNRLGLQPSEVDALLADKAALEGLDLQFVMSHLACADEPEHPLNEAQRLRFEALRQRFPGLKASFANSAGIFLGKPYHHDILRPGIALYGASPAPGISMQEVVRLEAAILQVREIDFPETVGYGAAYRVEKPSRIATLAVGYADGFLRSLSNRGFAALKGIGPDGQAGEIRVPLVGRVSMDMITLDVSALPPEHCLPGMRATLIGGAVPLDEQAGHAGTIAYELLTDLGRRYARVYR